MICPLPLKKQNLNWELGNTNSLPSLQPVIDLFLGNWPVSISIKWWSWTKGSLRSLLIVWHHTSCKFSFFSFLNLTYKVSQLLWSCPWVVLIEKFTLSSSSMRLISLNLLETILNKLLLFFRLKNVHSFRFSSPFSNSPHLNHLHPPPLPLILEDL
jgi:hypothetical protein